MLKVNVNRRTEKMIKKIRQEAKTLTDQADSWQKEQLQSLNHQYEDWHSRSSLLTTQRRWLPFAKTLLKNGSTTEQLASSKCLSERLAELQEGDVRLPKLISEKILFKPSVNPEEPIVGIIKTGISDASTDSGMCKFDIIALSISCTVHTFHI